MIIAFTPPSTGLGPTALGSVASQIVACQQTLDLWKTRRCPSNPSRPGCGEMKSRVQACLIATPTTLPGHLGAARRRGSFLGAAIGLAGVTLLGVTLLGNSGGATLLGGTRRSRKRRK